MQETFTFATRSQIRQTTLTSSIFALQKQNINIGTISWKYPIWRGAIYPKEFSSLGAFYRESLRFYAQTFSAVCVEDTKFGWPTEALINQYMNNIQVNPDFAFSFMLAADFLHSQKDWQQAEALHEKLQSNKVKHHFILQLAEQNSDQKSQLVSQVTNLLPIVVETKNSSRLAQSVVLEINSNESVSVSIEPAKLERWFDEKHKSKVVLRIAIASMAQRDVSVLCSKLIKVLRPLLPTAGELFIYFGTTNLQTLPIVPQITLDFARSLVTEVQSEHESK